MKKTIALSLICSIISIMSYSQDKYKDDSIKASQLIHEKVNLLQNSGAKNSISLFSNIGKIVIIYEIDNEIKAIKCNFMEGQKFKSVKLSSTDRVDYKNCILSTKKDTTINFSNCNEIVHSFNKIVFKIKTVYHSFSGNFTSDCADKLIGIHLPALFNIYRNILL